MIFLELTFFLFCVQNFIFVPLYQLQFCLFHVNLASCPKGIIKRRYNPCSYQLECLANYHVNKTVNLLLFLPLQTMVFCAQTFDTYQVWSNLLLNLRPLCTSKPLCNVVIRVCKKVLYLTNPYLIGFNLFTNFLSNHIAAHCCYSFFSYIH